MSEVHEKVLELMRARGKGFFVDGNFSLTLYAP